MLKVAWLDVTGSIGSSRWIFWCDRIAESSLVPSIWPRQWQWSLPSHPIHISIISFSNEDGERFHTGAVPSSWLGEEEATSWCLHFVCGSRCMGFFYPKLKWWKVLRWIHPSLLWIIQLHFHHIGFNNSKATNKKWEYNSWRPWHTWAVTKNL